MTRKTATVRISQENKDYALNNGTSIVDGVARIIAEHRDAQGNEPLMLIRDINMLKDDKATLEELCAEEERKNSELQNRLSSIDRDREGYLTQIDELRAVNLSLSQSVSGLSAEKIDLENEIKNVRSGSAAAIRERDGYKSRLETCNSRSERLDGELARANDDLKKEKANHEEAKTALATSARAYEGMKTDRDKLEYDLKRSNSSRTWLKFFLVGSWIIAAAVSYGHYTRLF